MSSSLLLRVFDLSGFVARNLSGCHIAQGGRYETDKSATGEPQYQQSMVVPLSQLTDNTMKLVSAALQGLKAIFRSGFHYKKSGVLLMGLQPKEAIQATLFDDPVEQEKSASMMRTIDAINKKMGSGSLTLAASGIQRRWAMRRDRKSPNYTTDWNELPMVF